jgi:hypothetical protein
VWSSAKIAEMTKGGSLLRPRAAKTIVETLYADGNSPEISAAGR